MMKLTVGLVAALAGFSSALQPTAQVYIIPAREASAAPPSLSPGLARLVLLQRLAAIGQGPSINDVPNDANTEDAVSAMTRFGKTSPVLFGGENNGEPSQLVMMLDEMTEQQMEDLGRAFDMKPAFTITDPPSSNAHEELVTVDFRIAGITDVNQCSLREIANPLEECWNGKQAAVAKYNANQDPDVLQQLPQRLAQLVQLAKSGELETTILLLPSTSNSKSWSDLPQELRRRQAEQVISSYDKAAASSTSAVPEKPIAFPSKMPIAACFNSKKSCMIATGNCSSHGSCLDRYASAEEDGKKKEACFACHCLSTKSESGKVTHWAGPSCAKADISVAFWLFVGFTVAMVGIVWLAIVMLFNVGEEPLPGVIGAGVSRSK
ncbi:hypothetical protein DCS_04483 [Drechmeria coniospora]|uniref:Vacuolar sorting protein Vps3844 C-terminal domain-containing protein n=1 Tax=Drechmeria coniospora TaxID=98403 RepID=A0A151GK27_DRECN|nr:hypothetical protein DCS_04483 [Drechmeria coniospora]KYK57473.1 hypothetical protein DCS_04483 [Drechmeria coniospora]ODA79379.1 hypothetical protein RJ55_04972 [Drechmeria coniospora]